MRECLTFVGFVLGPFFFIVISILVPCILISRANCYAAYEDFHPEWGFWSNCRVEWDGKKVPVDILRALEEKGK